MDAQDQGFIYTVKSLLLTSYIMAQVLTHVVMCVDVMWCDVMCVMCVDVMCVDVR